MRIGVGAASPAGRNTMKVTVILPTYNEAENIEPLVRDVLASLPDRGG